MATVTEDLVNGHRLEEILGGFEIERIFRITELTEAPHLQLLEAATDPGLPAIGDAYDPAYAQATCVNRDITPDGPNAARASLLYSTRQNRSSWNQPEPDPVDNDGQDVKQVSASIGRYSTTRDRDGNEMTLNPPAKLAGMDPYVSTAQQAYPIGRIVFERIEVSPPTARARTRVGTLNNAAIGPYLAEELLFSDFDAVSEDGGRTWRCTYTFDFDILRHKHRDTYKGPDGRAAKDATEEAFSVLRLSDFSQLGLDFGDAQTPIS